MTKQMRDNENNIKNALIVMQRIYKYRTIQEAIVTRLYISDTQKRMKKEGKNTFRGYNRICRDFLDNGIATKEEQRLQMLAENYIKVFEEMANIYSTISSLVNNDFLLTREDCEKEILRFNKIK